MSTFFIFEYKVLALGDLDRAKVIPTEIFNQLNSKSSSLYQSKNIALLQAELGNWGEALRLSHNCTSSDKVEVLAQILRVHAEQKHPEFKELRKKEE